MTSAINGRIYFKQDTRAYLDANKRSNSLVFDLDNSRLLYSPSGTNYVEFYPGQTSGGSASAVSWNNVTNQPIASTNTSGVLTSSDWNKFNAKADLSAVSGISVSGTIPNLITSGTQNIGTSASNSSVNIVVGSQNNVLTITSAYISAAKPILGPGDGSAQGGYIGTFNTSASLPGSAVPGSFATTRDGKVYVFS